MYMAAMTRYLRFAKLGPILLLFYLLFLTHDQFKYENFLQSVSITWDDFPTDYANALYKSRREDKELEYSWPPITAPEPTKQRTIPPNIHFIWFPHLYHDHLDVSQIPETGSHAPGKCREYNPNFNVQVWNTSAARSLLEEHYAWFLPTYDSYRHPIQRVDAFKYFVLWHYGGVYMDLDIACRRALDPLLPFAAWYPKATPFGINNDLMATRARHPLTELMLKQLKPRDKNLLFPYLTIFWSTGPQFTSDMVRKWAHKVGGSKTATQKDAASPDAVCVLPLEFYSEKYTFFGHSPGGTWHGNDVAVVLWLVDHPWLLLLVPTLPVSVILSVRQLRKSYTKREKLETP